MKLLIASDIHGDIACARALFEAFDREKADKMLLLGDLLYHGPRNDLPANYAPKEVISLLNEHKDDIFCVRGNCEADVDGMVLEFPVHAEYALLFLDGISVFATHGHHYPPEDCALKSGDCYLQGHTHVPMKEVRNGVLYLNPGSVSLPKNGAPKTYLVYEGKDFILKTMDGAPYSL